MINLVFQIVSALVRLAIQLGWVVGLLLGRLLVLLFSALRRTMKKRAASAPAAPIVAVGPERTTRRTVERSARGFQRPRPSIRPRPSLR